jgi:hypothetical protein
VVGNYSSFANYINGDTFPWLKIDLTKNSDNPTDTYVIATTSKVGIYKSDTVANSNNLILFVSKVPIDQTYIVSNWDRWTNTANTVKYDIPNTSENPVVVDLTNGPYPYVMVVKKDAGWFVLPEIKVFGNEHILER